MNPPRKEVFCQETIAKWLQGIPTKISTHLVVSNMSDRRIDDDQDVDEFDATPRQLRRQPASVLDSSASRSSQPQSDHNFSASNDIPSPTSGFTFAAALRTSGPFFPSLVEARSSRTPSPPKRPRASRHLSSPSKRPKTTASLERLERPVRFKRVKQKELPVDAQQLCQELFAVANSVGILPRALKHSHDFDGMQTLPFMWEPEDQASDLAAKVEQKEPSQSAEDVYKHMNHLVNESIDCANQHRSEAAWNAMVHYPALRFLLSEFPSVTVELITSSQIVKAFRPSWKETITDDDASSMSLGSTVSSASSATRGGPRGGGAASTSVHKMVDLALVLLPDKPLADTINSFLESEDPELATVNQTNYRPLCRRPAPIFIETKTSSGNSEAAKLQLGVWIAGYHNRLRSIMEQRPAADGNTERIITLPIVQWYDGACTVSFAVDTKFGIDILDVDLQVGGCNSLLGAYQLRKAVACLAAWMESQFRPWFTSLLTLQMSESRSAAQA